MEATLEALADAGLSAGRALSVWTALVAFTNGHVGYQIHGHLHGEAALDIDGDRFPRIARATAGEFDWDHAFNEGPRTARSAIEKTATKAAATNHGRPMRVLHPFHVHRGRGRVSTRLDGRLAVQRAVKIDVCIMH